MVSLGHIGAAALSLAVILGGCSEEDAGPATGSNPGGASPSSDVTASTEAEPDAPEEVTFEALGIDDWPTAYSAIDGSPPAPAERLMDTGRYFNALVALSGLADVTALKPGLRAGTNVLPRVNRALIDPIKMTLPQDQSDSDTPRLVSLNYFGNGIEVLGEPRVAHAWKTGPDPDDPGYRVQLQTWTAYEVQEGDSPTQVIAVFRESNLTETPTRADTSSVFRVVGGDRCAGALHDRLLPSESAELDDFDEFVKQGSRARSINYDADEVDSLDDVAEDCQGADN